MGFFDSFFSSPSAQNVGYTALNLGNATDIYSQYLGQSKYLGDLSNFSNQVNSLYQQQLSQSAPGLMSGISSASKNAESLINGEIPQDVQDQVARSAAATNMSTGVGVSSGMGRNLVARDLGLTSLNLQQQGTSMLGNITQLAQSVNPYTVQSQLFTPQQLLQRQDQQSIYNWQGQNQNNATNAAINTYNQNQTSPFEKMVTGAVSSLFSNLAGGASLGLFL